MKTYDMHTTIYFKTTEYGERAIDERAKEDSSFFTNKSVEEVRLKPWKDDWYKMTFWEVIELFGSRTYLGGWICIKEFTFEEPKIGNEEELPDNSTKGEDQ